MVGRLSVDQGMCPVALVLKGRLVIAHPAGRSCTWVWFLVSFPLFICFLSFVFTIYISSCSKLVDLTLFVFLFSVVFEFFVASCLSHFTFIVHCLSLLLLVTFLFSRALPSVSFHSVVFGLFFDSFGCRPLRFFTWPEVWCWSLVRC